MLAAPGSAMLAGPGSAMIAAPDSAINVEPGSAHIAGPDSGVVAATVSHYESTILSLFIVIAGKKALYSRHKASPTLLHAVLLCRGTCTFKIRNA